jgi:hypothetical protein
LSSSNVPIAPDISGGNRAANSAPQIPTQTSLIFQAGQQNNLSGDRPMVNLGEPGPALAASLAKPASPPVAATDEALRSMNKQTSVAGVAHGEAESPGQKYN